DDSAWLPVQVLPEFRGELRSQPFPNLAVTQVLRPLELPNLPQQPGRATLQYAFGSDVVGRLRLDLRCHEADDIRVHYSIDESFARATTDSFSTRRPLDHPDMQICEPAFALHSFRFVRVEYTNGATEVEDAFALRVAYAQQPALKMRSDHATLNELITVLHNSISGVAMPVPMRGVQQAERLPDAGYAATWVPMFAQQERAHPLVAKWLADMALANQNPDFDGPNIPPIPSALSSPVPSPVPSPIIGNNTRTDAVAQLETFIHLLWAVYRHHDDRPLLEKYYPLVRAATLAYRHQDEKLLRKDVDPQLFGRDYDAALVATCTFYGTLQIVAQMAAVLGLMADRELVQGLADALRNEFRRRYLTADVYLVGETQSGFVAALYNNLLEEPEQQLAAQGLIRKLQENQYHADVVPAVLRGLLPTLSRAGRLDMAYMVLLQTSQPSWFGNINAGSKLVARQPGVFDIAEVGLLEWLVESMMGITLDDRYGAEDNAYKRVRIQPMPPFGKQFLAGSPIQFVEAELHTIQGVFVVKWQIGPHKFTLDVVIPPSSTATVVMPDGIEHAVTSGRHAFVMDFDAGGDGIPTLLDTNVS
ncbi:MAG: alpha-L-rhamnosidase C-terminal domain-containing protein, partial [Pseudomonadota bacterium]